MRAILLFVALAACASSAPPERLHTPPVKPRPAAPAHVEIPAAPGADRWLVVEQHTHVDPIARYLAVELGEDPRTPPTILTLGQAPAMPYLYNAKRLRSVAAQDGNRWAHLERSDIRGVRAVIRSLPDNATRLIVELGDLAPAAFYLVGDALWIGARSKVGWVDLAARKPMFVTLVDRTGHHNKDYDLFARSGDRMLAIDDVVMPIYADWFSLDVRGAPAVRLGDWMLPSLANGHYTGAAIARYGEEYRLVTMSTFSSWGRQGQGMFGLAIRNDELIDATPERDADVSEGLPRGSYVGTAPGRWQGLAITPDGAHVVVAAGERGLIVYRSELPYRAARSMTIDLGASVRDVIVRGGTMLALTTTVDGDSELVVLERSGFGFKPAARHPLPGVLDRFVD